VRSSWLLCALALMISVPSVEAQSAVAPDADAQAQQGAQEAEVDDALLRLAEPEYRVVNIPTTLVLPRNKASFDLTHRFGENLARGSFGSHAGRLFGLDSGALIGFEFRYGIARRVQAAVYRTTIERTFQFHGKYDAVQQRSTVPVSISALLSVEGVENFTDDYAPSVGLVVSRTLGERAALYASPIWVHNTGPGTESQRDTAFLGLGGRVRVGATVYLVGEVSPRIGGFEPGKPEFGFGIEKRAGGHLFQLNFSNTQATTYRQVARGGFPETLYLGFNLARKFF
jgi:hypothetical protein